ncbi:MAG TPA: hypothetical protein VFC37_06390 [Terracidiphilus sp.]|nr:hypothetical protein [Terracidiphilus sp.]
MRLSVALVCLGLASICHAQLTHVPEAAHASVLAVGEAVTDLSRESSSADLSGTPDLIPAQDVSAASESTKDTNHGDPHPRPSLTGPVDANGNPIPLDRLQPQRILGFMPNFRTVSEGAKPHPPGWKYNFTVATRQSTDYSSFVFLGITSLSAEGINEHPVLGKGIPGMWAYSWRGFLDKTDNTYLSAWFLPSLIHEDTRFYAMGAGHPIPIRALYVISRQGVARTYGGRQTPNIAGLGGKVLTQLVSRTYYPTGATSFSVLAVKFGYSAMRDVAITSVREFYPDAAAHFIRKHREKMARLAAENDASVQ